MTITKHAIERFQERITYESPATVRFFIKSDIQKSTPLYRINHIEKRIINGVIYVLDVTKESHPIVMTLYLA
jgi:hypothetical protein